MATFKLSLSSRHKEWRRFRIRIMCELQDQSGERTGFVTAEGTATGVCELATGECRRIRTFIYAIPDSLPAERTVERCPDFPAHLRVECGGRTIADETLAINQWGGTSIERTFDSLG